MTLAAIKPDRSEQQKLVEMQLRDAYKEAVAEGAVGYVLIYTTKDDVAAVANVMPKNIREVVGYIELDVKPMLADLVYE